MKNKAFTIWETIVLLFMVSFCTLSITSLLLNILYYLTHLQTKVKIFYSIRTISSCYAVYKNQEFCKTTTSEPTL